MLDKNGDHIGTIVAPFGDVLDHQWQRYVKWVDACSSSNLELQGVQDLGNDEYGPELLKNDNRFS